jgi:hypothetical protein
MIVLIINSILLALILVALVVLAIADRLMAFWGLLFIAGLIIGPILIMTGYMTYAAETGLVAP